MSALIAAGSRSSRKLKNGFSREASRISAMIGMSIDRDWNAS
jgi:hypothetical protein